MAAKASKNTNGAQDERIIAEMLREKRHAKIETGLTTDAQQFLADVPGEKLDSVDQLKDLWPIWRSVEREVER